MTFPVCRAASEPVAYPLSDFLIETREKPQNGALIRFIPGLPNHPSMDLVLSFFGSQFVYPYKSEVPSEKVLRIFGLWLPEQFDAIMESREEIIMGEHLLTDVTRHVMNIRGQATPDKIVVLADNYFVYYRARIRVVESSLMHMPAVCVQLIQSYMS